MFFFTHDFTISLTKEAEFNSLALNSEFSYITHLGQQNIRICDPCGGWEKVFVSFFSHLSLELHKDILPFIYLKQGYVR